MHVHAHAPTHMYVTWCPLSVVAVIYQLMYSETYLMVNNYQEQRTIYNVIATIYGRVEPGRLTQAHQLQ